jgi:predicted MFS family arabinose efflux permease
MQEVYKFVFGILLLVLGIPIGNILAKMTKEELKPGRIWFKPFILISLIFAVIFLVLRNDTLLFVMLFIAIVTSRSLKK